MSEAEGTCTNRSYALLLCVRGASFWSWSTVGEDEARLLEAAAALSRQR